MDKKDGAKLEKVPQKDEKVEVLELDELCVNKKTSDSGPQQAAPQSGLSAFRLALEKQKSFPKLANKISHIDTRFYASDHWHAYNLIVPTKHLTGKVHTYTVDS